VPRGPPDGRSRAAIRTRDSPCEPRSAHGHIYVSPRFGPPSRGVRFPFPPPRSRTSRLPTSDAPATTRSTGASAGVSNRSGAPTAWLHRDGRSRSTDQRPCRFRRYPLET
jgi:hypothetical protein